jgi:dTMP kinase
LYSASRHQLIKERIVPELNQGNIVICDRFYDSTTVYQGCARGLDLDFIHSLNRLVSENHKPDLTFVIDIPLEERLRRVQPKRLDRLENENDKFQQRVREGFVQLATDNPDRVRLLDGALGREELSDIIWNMFMNLTKG